MKDIKELIAAWKAYIRKPNKHPVIWPPIDRSANDWWSNESNKKVEK